MTESAPQAISDVLIIGGGAAGLSALLWCSDLGLSAQLLEGSGETGGQFLKLHGPITNYPGSTARNGREMLKYFMSQLTGVLPFIRLNSRVVDLDVNAVSVTLEDGTSIFGRSVIIATGVRRRRLNIPGEREFEGRGILDSGVQQADTVTGRTVAVIGGGDAALENALMLSKLAKRLYLIHRRDNFTARQKFLERLESAKNVAVMVNSTVTSISGDDAVTSIDVKSGPDDRIESLPVDAVLIRVGVEPNVDAFRDLLDLDPRGYIRVDHLCRTSSPFILAVGDVANPVSPTIATAAGTAATSVKTIYALLYGKSGI